MRETELKALDSLGVGDLLGSAVKNNGRTLRRGNDLDLLHRSRGTLALYLERLELGRACLGQLEYLAIVAEILTVASLADQRAAMDARKSGAARQ